MEKREQIIKHWFDMWNKRKDLGIKDIFTDYAEYIESWGPTYIGNDKIAHWFNEWNTRGKVLEWEIEQFIHTDNQTIVIWSFVCQMNGEDLDTFDGISVVSWSAGNKICSLKEYACSKDNYDPYENSQTPQYH